MVVVRTVGEPKGGREADYGDVAHAGSYKSAHCGRNVPVCPDATIREKIACGAQWMNCVPVCAAFPPPVAGD